MAWGGFECDSQHGIRFVDPRGMFGARHVLT